MSPPFFALILALSARAPDYSAEDLAEGKRLYTEFCASCHGLDGKGDPPERSVKTRPLDLTNCSFTTGETDFDWETVVYHGGPAAGLSPDMASWGESLGMEKTRQLIAYMRSFCTESGWPHGELNFARPLLTEKAFPENELVIEMSAASPKGRAADLATSVVFEKRLGKRGQYELVLPFATVSDASGVRATGLADIEAGVKYVLAYSRNRGTIVSAGFDLGIPTGGSSSGLGKGTPVYEPFLSFGQRLGSFEAQAQLLYERPHDESRGEPELVLHSALGRPLTKKLASPWAFVELTFEKELDSKGEWTLSLTPELRYPLSRADHLAMSVGIQIPVAGEGAYRYRALFYFLWEYLEGGIWW